MNYPKGERVWTDYRNAFGQLRFTVTSTPSRDYYFLYEVDDEKLKKLGKAKTPTELEEKFKICDKLKRGL